MEETSDLHIKAGVDMESGRDARDDDLGLQGSLKLDTSLGETFVIEKKSNPDATEDCPLHENLGILDSVEKTVASKIGAKSIGVDDEVTLLEDISDSILIPPSENTNDSSILSQGAKGVYPLFRSSKSPITSGSSKRRDEKGSPEGVSDHRYHEFSGIILQDMLKLSIHDEIESLFKDIGNSGNLLEDITDSVLISSTDETGNYFSSLESYEHKSESFQNLHDSNAPLTCQNTREARAVLVPEIDVISGEGFQGEPKIASLDQDLIRFREKETENEIELLEDINDSILIPSSEPDSLNDDTSDYVSGSLMIPQILDDNRDNIKPSDCVDKDNIPNDTCLDKLCSTSGGMNDQNLLATESQNLMPIQNINPFSASDVISHQAKEVFSSVTDVYSHLLTSIEDKDTSKKSDVVSSKCILSPEDNLGEQQTQIFFSGTPFIEMRRSPEVGREPLFHDQYQEPVSPKNFSLNKNVSYSNLQRETCFLECVESEAASINLDLGSNSMLKLPNQFSDDHMTSPKGNISVALMDGDDLVVQHLQNSEQPEGGVEREQYVYEEKDLPIRRREVIGGITTDEDIVNFVIFEKENFTVELGTDKDTGDCVMQKDISLVQGTEVAHQQEREDPRLSHDNIRGYHLKSLSMEDQFSFYQDKMFTDSRDAVELAYDKNEKVISSLHCKGSFQHGSASSDCETFKIDSPKNQIFLKVKRSYRCPHNVHPNLEEIEEEESTHGEEVCSLSLQNACSQTKLTESMQYGRLSVTLPETDSFFNRSYDEQLCSQVFLDKGGVCQEPPFLVQLTIRNKTSLTKPSNEDTFFGSPNKMGSDLMTLVGGQEAALNESILHESPNRMQFTLRGVLERNESILLSSISKAGVLTETPGRASSLIVSPDRKQTALMKPPYNEKCIMYGSPIRRDSFVDQGDFCHKESLMLTSVHTTKVRTVITALSNVIVKCFLFSHLDYFQLSFIDMRTSIFCLFI